MKNQKTIFVPLIGLASSVVGLTALGLIFAAHRPTLVPAPPMVISQIDDVVVGGTSYRGLEIRSTRDQFLDAGLSVKLCDSRVVSCQVRVDPTCRAKLDAGSAYALISTKVLLCPAVAAAGAASPFLIFRWQPCYQLAGPPDEVCALTDLCGDGGTDCAEDPSGVQPVKSAQSRCACSQPDAGLCQIVSLDGGFIPAPLGVNLQPGKFKGSGCTRKACYEIAGAMNESWPQGCPL